MTTEQEILDQAAQIRRDRAEHRLVQFRKRSQDLASLNILLPDRKYSVLYADPPWKYSFTQARRRAIENHYPTMTTNQIAALDVPAADDSILFLWATSPKLADAMQVISGWGFKYITSMVWVKDRWGMGYYARQRHELLLIGKRGTPPVPVPSSRPDSVIDAPRTKHSSKPPEVYNIIEAMYPDIPKLELFCRTPQPGWDVWGNEIAVGIES